MILMKPSHEILTTINSGEILQRIEAAGRTCYKSERKITTESAVPFVRSIIKNSHESVIEHESISVRFICDRGVTHELVRHRLAAFSQESTRYCDYVGKDEAPQVTFIIPPWVEIAPGEYHTPDEFSTAWNSDHYWAWAMLDAERYYATLRQHEWSPQSARAVLPNSLKTEIVMTSNLREWRHVLKLRTSAAAHPQMRELMMPLLLDLTMKIPVVFDDIPSREGI
ncbi:MAG: FAD-dependent thymidylate synthase [Syntrophaceae bacterium]|nr:FAD-dependent thymidylate synthase [Syntrophaceae bacterium]